MKLYTIGFTGKNAATFFGLLQKAKVKTLLDIRLNNRSQLAGFTKAGDLEYFLAEICAIGYRHSPDLAPDQELLDLIRGKKITWDEYQLRFRSLMEERAADTLLKQLMRELPGPLCLLCSEANADQCHRSLVAKRMQSLKPKLEVIHL